MWRSFLLFGAVPLTSARTQLQPVEEADPFDEIDDLFKELQKGLQKNLDDHVGDQLEAAKVRVTLLLPLHPLQALKHAWMWSPG